MVSKANDWHEDIYLFCEAWQYDIGEHHPNYAIEVTYELKDFAGTINTKYHYDDEYMDWNIDVSDISDLIEDVEADHSMVSIIRELLSEGEYEEFSSGKLDDHQPEFHYFIFKSEDEFVIRFINRFSEEYS